jgi:hypothetical protein
MSEKKPNAEYILWMMIQSFLENCEIDPEEDLETARLVASAISFGVYQSLHAIVHGYEMPNNEVAPVITIELAEAAEATMEKIQDEVDEEDDDDEDEGDWVKDADYAEAFAKRLKTLRKAFGQDEPEPEQKKGKKGKPKDDDESLGVGPLPENFVEAMYKSDPHSEMTRVVAGTTLEAQMDIENQTVPEPELRGQRTKPNAKKAN